MADLESVQHLFFYCEYAAEVWKGICLKMGYSAARCHFQNSVLQACKYARKKSGKLFVMLFTECVYAIWRQRNNKLFRSIRKDPKIVIREVLFRVAARCSEEDRCRLLM